VMAVDPYSPCPCGSGQKFKWCCHKVEGYAERSLKLYENGQIEQALGALAEGLKKEPDNAWLLSRKALILTREDRPEEAKEALRPVLARQPRNLGPLALMTRLVLATEGAAAGVAMLHQALIAFPKAERRGLLPLVRMIGAVLGETSHFPAARQHLMLALTMGGADPNPEVVSTLRSIIRNPTTPLWLRNDDLLSPAPEGLSGEAATRFSQALGWADEGLWSAAAAAFETLTADPVAGPLAERNLGLCRLWLAADDAAVAALRRYTARVPVTTDTVDLEVLCQILTSEEGEETVEQLQLVWPVRDRPALLEALGADPAVYHEGKGPIDPSDEHAPEAEVFVFLDRPDPFRGPDGGVTDGGAGLSADAIPKIVGRVYVGLEFAALESFDDGRLDGLSERFTTLAGASLTPAHPRTKVLGKVLRPNLALTWEWQLPEGTSRETALRLSREQGSKLIQEVWPTIPRKFLAGRSPLQAAGSPGAELPLRAAVRLLESSRELWRDGFDFAVLRNRLKIGPEPEVDPETVDPATIHLSRLSYIPAERLSGEKLAAVYKRSRNAVAHEAIEPSALALVKRPDVMEAQEIEPLAVYGDLASVASLHDRHQDAADWLRRGRQADVAANRARNAPQWDMLEIQLLARTTEPEVWVPELAVILERYHENHDATRVITLGLVEMGLLEMGSTPDRPGEILIDPRPLQALLQTYGPRVTTTSGRLGVSAARPEIWTPGAATGSTGGIWTPGSTPPPGGGGEKKNIIITGR
jgi:hypothetical protein